MSDLEIAVVVTMVKTLLASKARAEAELRAEMGLPASGARSGKRDGEVKGKAATARKVTAVIIRAHRLPSRGCCIMIRNGESLPSRSRKGSRAGLSPREIQLQQPVTIKKRVVAAAVAVTVASWVALIVGVVLVLVGEGDWSAITAAAVVCAATSSVALAVRDGGKYRLAYDLGRRDKVEELAVTGQMTGGDHASSADPDMSARVYRMDRR